MRPIWPCIGRRWRCARLVASCEPRRQSAACAPGAVLYNPREFTKKGSKHSMLGKQSKFVSGAFVALMLGLALAFPASAAPPEGMTAEQVAALEQRVKERWQALSEADYGRAWEFSTPNYRSVFPKELYVLQFSYAVERRLTGVEVLDYDAAAAVASVTARVMSKPLKQTSEASVAIGALPLDIREKWIFIEGQWWYSSSGE